MKKIYKNPMINICFFEKDDVISTSFLPSGKDKYSSNNSSNFDVLPPDGSLN